MKTLATAAGLALALAAGTANAATYNFAYTSSFNKIGGKLDGTLQGDGKTVVVTGVHDFVRVNSGFGLSLPFVYSSDSLYGGSQPAFVTTDGSAMSLLACGAEFCPDEGFVFDTTGNLDVFPLFGGGGSFDRPQADFFREPFVTGNWSLSVAPEPGSWALLIIGFALTGGLARRQRVAVA